MLERPCPLTPHPQDPVEDLVQPCSKLLQGPVNVWLDGGACHDACSAMFEGLKVPLPLSLLCDDSGLFLIQDVVDDSGLFLIQDVVGDAVHSLVVKTNQNKRSLTLGPKDSSDSLAGTLLPS